jgi:hypothetical protein
MVRIVSPLNICRFFFVRDERSKTEFSNQIFVLVQQCLLFKNRGTAERLFLIADIKTNAVIETRATNRQNEIH